MNPVLTSISQTLANQLGSQLEAVILFGSQVANHYQTAVSNTNLLLITQDHISIQAIRKSFEPLWQAHRNLLGRGPLVASRQTLRWHLKLNPHLALHLLQHGQQLAGKPLSPDLFRTSLNPYEIYAHLAQQLLDASAALSHSQANDPQPGQQLNRLARQISQQTAARLETPLSQFSAIHQNLTAVISQLPAAKTWIEASAAGPTSPDIPGLQAIYSDNNKNVFVFNRLSPERVHQINWQLLARYLPQSNATLHITTVANFCLLALYDKALDLRFNKFEHKWGIHFLAELHPPVYQILRQAARNPSHILVDALPHSYLTAASTGDEELHKIIHDYQNRMLNIQLENELLFRLGLVQEKFAPPTPLPERDVPLNDRLEAIFQHLTWWGDFYQEAIQAKT